MKEITKHRRATASPTVARCAVGLLAAASILFVYACKSTLLDERFHSNDLNRWTVIDDPETVEGPSVWRVEADGWLHQRSNIWGRRGDFIGRWYGTMLVAGDAGWRDYSFSVRAKANDIDGFGVVFPQLFGRNTALAETRATLEAIGRLGVDVVIPGHGRSFGDAGAALERALYRLEGYEEDITRLARHCAKVMLSFAMLEKRCMPLAELPAYVARVPILAELNSRYLRMAPAAMVEWLLNDLERAGALRRENDMLVATGS